MTLMLPENLSSVELSATVTENNQNAAYFSVANLTVLVFDYLLTLELEVALIWGTPWNLGKILFFSTRYPVFIEAGLLVYFHISPSGGFTPIKTCRIIYQTSGWLIFMGTTIAEFVLTFRTWAIWGQSRKVAIGLLALIFVLAVPAVYLTFVGESSVEYIQSPPFLTQRCLVAKIHRKTILSDYIVVVALETVILILTLIKGAKHYRYSPSSLIKTLYQDGVIYYVYLTAISIANVCVYALLNKTHGISLIMLQRVFHSIFAARILLHLRLAVSKHRNPEGSNHQVLTSVVTQSQAGYLSSFIFGTETWCRSQESSGEPNSNDH